MIYKFNKKLNAIVSCPNCLEDYLELTQDVFYDCDGYETVNNLKNLVDEGSGYITKAQICLKNGFLYRDKYIEETTLKKAEQQYDEYNNDIKR